jgi:deoxyribodipyrimidine photo-lyase
MNAVFLFHRDLRLADNSALNLAIRQGFRILPVFIFNPEQIDESKNRYFSHPSVQFMCESLLQLDSDLHQNGSRLYMLYGNNVDVINELHSVWKFQHLLSNRDFTVFARERDESIKQWCRSKSVTFTDCEDYDIVPLNRVVMNEGTPRARPFTVLGSYFNQLLKDVRRNPNLIPPPFSESISRSTFVSEPIECPNYPLLRNDDLRRFYVEKSTLIQKGGRSNGVAVLSRVGSLITDYKEDRNLPAKVESTTRISAHLKFGTVSSREFFHRILECPGGGIESHLMRELAFRSFFFKIWAYQPELQRDKSFRQDVDDHISWRRPEDHPEEWEAWTRGLTGFPLADAGMRQLEVEGFVHNRPRMVLGTIATRHFLFDWRDCARYLATKLTDYDPIQNNAGWNYCAHLGENVQHVSRSPMNPFTQSKNYDVDCEYIKYWIPELRDVKASDIHNWSAAAKRKYPGVSYPAPIIDFREASARTTSMWQASIRASNS